MRSLLSAAVACAATASLVTGCTTTRSAPASAPSAVPTETASVSVTRAAGGRLQMADGAAVAVPRGAVSAGGHLTGSVIAAPVSSSSLVQLLGSAYRFEVEGARLTGVATVTLPVPGSVPRGAPVWLVYFDQSAGGWSVVPSRYDAKTRTVSGSTPHLSTWGLVSIDPSAVKADISGIVKGFFGVPDAAQPSCPGSAPQAGIKVTSSSGSLVKWCAGPAADAIAGGAVVRIVNNHGFAIEAGYPVSWTVTRLGKEEDWQTRLLDDAALGLSPQPASRSAIVIPGGGEIELHVPAGQAGTVNTMVSGPAILASAFLLGIQVLAFTYDRLPWFPKSSPSRLDKVVSELSSVHDCTASAQKLMGDDPSTPSGVGGIFRADLDYVFGCLKDAWKDAYGLKGVIATVAVSVALIVADAAVALVEGVSAVVDAVRYFSGYQITVASLGPPCAPRELLPKDGNGEQWTMLNYACLDGYALALAKTTFTTGGSPSEDGIATFRAVGNEWVIYGGWDDGVCLLGTPTVCGGLARAPGTEPPHDILVQLVHAAGLSVSGNGANVQSPTS